jgi:mono/diheme cytochrome c family protein
MRHAWLVLTPALMPALALAAAPAFAQNLDATQKTGQHLFNQSCRVCHAKPQLTSVQYGPVLSKESASGSAQAMHEVIANGTPRMPGFKYQFKPEQIDAIVAYLMTVPPPAAPASAPAKSRSGADAD